MTTKPVCDDDLLEVIRKDLAKTAWVDATDPGWYFGVMPFVFEESISFPTSIQSGVSFRLNELEPITPFLAVAEDVVDEHERKIGMEATLAVAPVNVRVVESTDGRGYAGLLRFDGIERPLFLTQRGIECKTNRATLRAAGYLDSVREEDPAYVAAMTAMYVARLMLTIERSYMDTFADLDAYIDARTAHASRPRSPKG